MSLSSLRLYVAIFIVAAAVLTANAPGLGRPESRSKNIFVVYKSTILFSRSRHGFSMKTFIIRNVLKLESPKVVTSRESLG